MIIFGSFIKVLIIMLDINIKIETIIYEYYLFYYFIIYKKCMQYVIN